MWFDARKLKTQKNKILSLINNTQMNVYFPSENEFCNNLCLAIKNSGQEDNFIKKWGLKSLSDIHKILVDNIQGGYSSHKKTILEETTGESVLTIGPGMGFCAFFLSEIYKTVYVAEPDHENCVMLEAISKHYLTNKQILCSDILQIFNSGLSINDQVINYWEERRELLKKRKKNGCVLNFSLKKANELKHAFDKKVSRIYLHKVYSSLSVSIDFYSAIKYLSEFIEEDGVITWSEPDYIFHESQKTNDSKELEKSLNKNLSDMNLHIIVKPYTITYNKEEDRIQEKWLMLNLKNNGLRN